MIRDLTGYFVVTVHDNKGQRTHCLHCGKGLQLEGCAADLKGPAYKAFYCWDCIRGGKHLKYRVKA